MKTYIYSQSEFTRVFYRSQEISPANFLHIWVGRVDIFDNPIWEGNSDMVESSLLHLLEGALCNKIGVMSLESNGSLIPP